MNANRTISLWNVEAGATQTVLGDTCPIKAPIINNWRTLAWSPDGKHLAAGGDRDPVDNPADTLAVWNTQTWLIEQCLDADNADSLTWSPDSQFLARSGAFNTMQVIVWDINTWAEAFRIDAGARGSFVRWSDGGRFIAYDRNSRVGFQEVATGNSVEPIEQPWEAEVESPPTALEWSPNGDFVAVVTQDSKLYVVEWNTGQTILQRSIPSMRQIAWHLDSNRIAVAGLPGIGVLNVSRGELREFDLPTAEPEQTTGVDAVAWSPSGRNLAAIVRVNGRAGIWIWTVNF